MRLVFGQPQRRHGSSWFNGLGVSYPPDQVFRGIRQLPGDHCPAAEKHQRRTHQALRRLDARNGVTGTAAIGLDQFLAMPHIAIHANRIAGGFLPAEAA